MQKIFNDILSVLGTTNMEAIITQSHQESEQLAVLQEKIKKLQKAEEQLAQTEEDFARKKEEISKKFAPADGDDADTLWQKMMGLSL